MLVYLVDDRGPRGEYAHFLQAYVELLPPFELKVFTHWQALYDAIRHTAPDGILADMRFDETPSNELYGDIDKLAETFCGNRARAEAQIRGMQGLMITRALRDNNIKTPVILFAAFNDSVKARILSQVSDLEIIDGLRIEEVRSALLNWSHK